MARFTSVVRYALLSRHKYGYGIHSPFLYHLIREVFLDKTEYPEYIKITHIRDKMKQLTDTTERVDFGAGHQKEIRTSFRHIVRTSSIRPKYGKLLFRMSNYLKPQRILELGTSLGIGTMYLAMGNRDTTVLTLEGDPLLGNRAKENFRKLSLERIRVVDGKFTEVLPDILTENKPFDLVFIDGDHRGEALMQYFEQIRIHLNAGACVILDDIHWNKDMEEGWKKVRNIPGVTLSLDLLQIGMLFFKPELSRQHYVIRY